MARKIVSHRRGNNGDDLFLFVQVAEKRGRVIHNKPRLMGTGMDAISASDAEIVVDGYLLHGAIVAVLYRAGSDTGMTVNTFFLINPNDRRQYICLHKLPLLISQFRIISFF